MQSSEDDLVKDLLANKFIEKEAHSTDWCAAGHFIANKDGSVWLITQPTPHK